jgi:osmotically-inducible protein OsmY
MLSIAHKPDSPTIVRLAERRLRESPYFFLKQVRCRFDGGRLTLEGRVPFSPLRKFAEAIVARVEGVREIDNHIEVYDPELAALQRAKGA